MYEFKTEFQGYPDRNSLTYKEIEGFESYELLSCIAYESAIRVPEVKTELLHFYKDYKTLTIEASKKKYSATTFTLNFQALHQKSLLNKFGFDLEATSFFILKKDKESYKIKNKVLRSTPTKFSISKHNDIIKMTKEKDGTITRTSLNSEKILFEVILSLQKLQKIEDIGFEEFEFEEFLENKEAILEEFIVDEESLDNFIKLVEYREVKRSMNWDEFHSAPILNLQLSMQRPIIKRRVMHKHLSLTLNFNLPLKELQEQLKIYKEVYDNHADENKKIDDNYISSIKDHRFSSFQVSALPSCHRNKNLLTAGEIGCTDNVFEPTEGKSCKDDIEYIDFFRYHDSFNEKKIVTSKIYADIFFLYDCLKLLEKYNYALEREKAALLSIIRSDTWEEKTEKEYIEQINNDFNKKKISKTETSILLYQKIKDKKSENRGNKGHSKKNTEKSTLVYNHWSFAKKLIAGDMYKTLM